MSRFIENPLNQPPDQYEYDYTVEVTFRLAVDAYDHDSAKHLGRQMAENMARTASGRADSFEIGDVYREH